MYEEEKNKTFLEIKITAEASKRPKGSIIILKTIGRDIIWKTSHSKIMVLLFIIKNKDLGNKIK